MTQRLQKPSKTLQGGGRPMYYLYVGRCQLWRTTTSLARDPPGNLPQRNLHGKHMTTSQKEDLSPLLHPDDNFPGGRATSQGGGSRGQLSKGVHCVDEFQLLCTGSTGKFSVRFQTLSLFLGLRNTTRPKRIMTGQMGGKMWGPKRSQGGNKPKPHSKEQ